MKLLVKSAAVTMLVLSIVVGAFGFQRIADWGSINTQTGDKAEFYWSRLSYTVAMGAGGYGGFGGGYGRGRFGGGYGWGATWQRDYPKADRQFLMALNRLTRINGRSYEQVVSPDSDDIFNYPFVYAVMVHTWSFNDAEAKRMREYLLKGGFLMVDDFHGTQDWEDFMRGMRQIFPDAEKFPVEDLTDKDEIFHVLYDMDDRFQVPGEQYIRSGQTYEKDGYVAKWRAIRDEHGRIMVAICHNMHLGDAWEWADDPEYPEQFSSMAFRVGLNYVMYSMTH
ncbi:MAG TPA: DUF4159 domain-containing protein [Acidobacteriaceae bacterium]|nr:DUF4159 domain-containing protein [Acidobacteriaceae bacterium]